MDRADQRLFVGALCGVGLIVSVSLLMRQHVHWVGVWRWVMSPRGGLLVLTVGGLVCQLGGVVLVVLELSRSKWRLSWLDHWLGELGKMMDAIDPEKLAREAAEENERLNQGTFVLGADLLAPLYGAYVGYRKQTDYLVQVTNIEPPRV